jgi:hypothetical protein
MLYAPVACARNTKFLDQKQEVSGPETRSFWTRNKKFLEFARFCMLTDSRRTSHKHAGKEKVSLKTNEYKENSHLSQ